MKLLSNKSGMGKVMRMIMMILVVLLVCISFLGTYYWHTVPEYQNLF